MDLKKQINQSGLSQKSIAKRIGVTNIHLNYMLNGKRDLPDKYKIEILNLLNKVG